MERHSLTRPFWVLAVCAAVAVLHFSRAALIPLALSLLVALMLSGVVEALRRRHIPRAVSAALLLGLFMLAMGAMIDLIATPAQDWTRRAPQILHTIERKVGPVRLFIQRLDRITQGAAALAEGEKSSPAPPAQMAAPSTAANVFLATGWLAFGTITVLGFSFLLLATGPPALARTMCALARRRNARHVLRTIHAIRREVGQYYCALLLINLCFGVIVAISMWLLGMPNPPLWGALAGLLNFIPYLGPAVTATVLAVVAIVTFPDMLHVALVTAIYLGLAAVEGHVVEPIFLGGRLRLSPVLVLVAVWLGGWLWGIAGIVVALPTLLAVRVTRTIGQLERDDAAERALRAAHRVVVAGYIGTGTRRIPELSTRETTSR